MQDNELLEPMKAAVYEAAHLVSTIPAPASPATTWGEFLEAFAKFDEPTTRLLRTRLSALRPDAVWAEEVGTELPESGEAWVVDALDGAVQLLQGLPQWAISVTLVRDRRPVATVLHSPVLGETYTAAAGFGAFRDGRAITPSAKSELKVSLLATSQPPTVADEPAAVARAGASLAAVLPVAGAVRNLGPTSWQIADTAAGRIDAFWEFGLDDGNLLGGALLAEEAGALVTDAAGRPWRAGASSFLDAPAKLHGQLVELLA